MGAGRAVGAGVAIMVAVVIAVQAGGHGGSPGVGQPSGAPDFFVATTGSDSNDGSSGSPFLTFNKCYQTIATAGGICEVRPGRFLPQSIQQDSPVKTGLVTFRAPAGSLVTDVKVADYVHLGTTQTFTVGTSGYTLDLVGGETEHHSDRELVNAERDHRRRVDPRRRLLLPNRRLPHEHADRR
jgi:hypothetical protein